MATSLTSVPGAAASAILPLVMGAIRDGTVLGVFSRAVVIGLDTEAGPRVVSLLAPGAASVPNGVRFAGDDFPGVLAGGRAEIGTGWVRVGSLQVRTVRSWSTRVMTVRPDGPGVAVLAAVAAGAERGVSLGAINRLETALAESADCGNDLDQAVDGLVGLGRGLTPGGDDVLAGLLTGLHAVGRKDLAARIGDRALHAIAGRTPLLSADLLRLAADGQACLEALAVLRAIHRPRPAAAARGRADPPLTEATHRLLSIGHTSGADLATGLSLGLALGLRSNHEAAMTAAGQGA